MNNLEKINQLYYRQHVFCCLNSRPNNSPRGCCDSKGAKKLVEYFKNRIKELAIQNIRINTSGCLNRCELGPVMVIYPAGVWYNYQTTADIDQIIDQHLINNQIVKHLFLQTNQKRLNE